MTTSAYPRFPLKPVVAALALAAAAGAPHAAPTPNQMPGAGTVTALSIAGAVQVNGGGAIPVGTTITGLTNGARIDVADKVVLNWGVSGVVDAANPHGFNLGSNAVLIFGGQASTVAPSVLNIDVSGNPSQVYGSLVSTAAPWMGCPACTTAPSIWVANANGIVVGAGGRIVAPAGVGLVGANLNNATSLHEFTGSNGWVIPAAPSYGTSYVGYGTIPASGNVTIAGAINGDLVNNVPAKYIFIAGNSLVVMNTGNLFGDGVSLNAGLVAAPQSADVGGLSNQSVNRMFDVDARYVAACCTVGPNLGNINVVTGISGNVVNEGSISTTGSLEVMLIQASGNIRSGVAGGGSTQIGLFSDKGISIDSYSNSGRVELYNVVSGYTANKTLPFLYVNVNAYFSDLHPDVTIDALTPGAQPSSIATTGGVSIFGGNVSILSTINHRSMAAGGTQQDWSTSIVGTAAVIVAADVGGGREAAVDTRGGPLTISGNVMSDTDGNGNGGIWVFNEGAGTQTTISGNLTVPANSTGYIDIGANGPLSISGNLANVDNTIRVINGDVGTGVGNITMISGNLTAGDRIEIANRFAPAGSPLTISGSVTADGNVVIETFGASARNETTISGNVTSNFGDVAINPYHPYLPSIDNLTVTGKLSAFNDVAIFTGGVAQIGRVDAGNGIRAEVTGTTFGINDAWTAGNWIDINSPIAMTKLKPAGVLTAPSIDLTGLNFTGVNATGAGYANLDEKPVAQIVTNDLEVTLTGSINGPVAGTTNWLVNSMDIAPLNTLGAVGLSISANGGGFQAVNLRVLGDAWVDSGATTTPFIGVPLTSGGLPAGGLQGNLGSQLIVQADGYLEVYGTPTGTLFGPPQAFQWPGGAVFKAGTTLQTFTPIYNAWSVASPPFGGVFFEAPYIALGGIIATSGTAWANFSTQPVTGDPVVYQIRQLTPTTFGFEATTEFVHNTYSHTVTGGAPCIVTGPTTWTACP